MTQTFVPLVPEAWRAVESSTRSNPVSAPAPQRGFQPATPATLKPEPIPSPAPHTMHGEPKITLERQGETITHIRIQCACGQVIELKCDY
jgi:hypothetical protein